VPKPYRFDPAMIKRLSKAFLDAAAACVLYAGNTHLVEADGHVETIRHEVTPLNGRNGAAEAELTQEAKASLTRLNRAPDR
jgi:hypothetical protein